MNLTYQSRINKSDPSSSGESLFRNDITDQRMIRMPKIIWIILIATCLAHIGPIRIFGFKIAGWAWVIPLISSMFIIFRKPRQVSFPLFIWVPWILLLFIHLIISEYYSLQRTVQLVCPIIIAMAVSTYRINIQQIDKFFSLCRRFSIIFFLLALYTTGTLLTGRIPNVSGLAGEGMTCVLMCCLFSTSYMLGEKNDLKYWLLMAGYTVFAMVRITILGAIATFPLNLGSFSVKKRFVSLGIVLCFCFIVFNSDRFQNKMFRTGNGTIADISYSSEKMSDSGRRFMWDSFIWKINKKPWLGYGAGSGEVFTTILTNGTVPYPHNDWLLTLHDYGIIGMTIFLICIILAMVHAWHSSRRKEKSIRILFLTGILSFVIFLIMMCTDNIMVYNNFYGNLQFAIIGIAYAASRTHILNQSTNDENP